MAGIWIGTSGFSYTEWRPSFYPAGLPEKDFLRHYATRFNSVEIDSSFYRVPAEKSVADWKAATGEGFRFTLKLSRRVTHIERLKVPSEALDFFIRVARGLGRKLGPLLVQLPPFFRRDVPRLEAFLAALPTGTRAALEFRHASWFERETYDALRAHGAALCVRDDGEGTTPLELTAPFTCVRLRRFGYDAAGLDAWRRRFRDWSAAGADVFAYVKHKDNPDAPAIARRFAG